MINQYNSIYAPTKPSHIPPNGKFGKSSTEKCRLEWDMSSETQEGITVVSYQVNWTWQPCYIFTEGVGYLFFFGGGGEPYNFTRWANISNYITSLWPLKTVSFDLKCQLWGISRPLRHVFNTDVGSVAALHWDTGTYWDTTTSSATTNNTSTIAWSLLQFYQDLMHFRLAFNTITYAKKYAFALWSRL